MRAIIIKVHWYLNVYLNVEFKQNSNQQFISLKTVALSLFVFYNPVTHRNTHKKHFYLKKKSLIKGNSLFVVMESTNAIEDIYIYFDNKRDNSEKNVATWWFHLYIVPWHFCVCLIWDSLNWVIVQCGITPEICRDL